MAAGAAEHRCVVARNPPEVVPSSWRATRALGPWWPVSARYSLISSDRLENTSHASRRTPRPRLPGPRGRTSASKQLPSPSVGARHPERRSSRPALPRSSSHRGDPLRGQRRLVESAHVPNRSQQRGRGDPLSARARRPRRRHRPVPRRAGDCPPRNLPRPSVPRNHRPCQSRVCQSRSITGQSRGQSRVKWVPLRVPWAPEGPVLAHRP